jgi:hypothetical protein
MIRKHVFPGSVIYTDEFATYDGIKDIKLRGRTGGTPANYQHFARLHLAHSRANLKLATVRDSTILRERTFKPRCQSGLFIWNPFVFYPNSTYATE